MKRKRIPGKGRLFHGWLTVTTLALLAWFLPGGLFNVSPMDTLAADPSLEPQWSKTFGGTGSDQGYFVQQTSDGGYIIAGVTDSFGASGSDVYLIKTDASGNLTWQKTIGGTAHDRGNSLQQTSDGGYIIVGDTTSFSAGSYDVYLVKTA